MVITYQCFSVLKYKTKYTISYTYLLYHCHSGWHQTVRLHLGAEHWLSIGDSAHLMCVYPKLTCNHKIQHQKAVIKAINKALTMLEVKLFV